MILKGIEIGYTKPLVCIDELELKKGEIYALFGANGKGKSTLLATLCGRQHPLKGKITIEERELHTLELQERSKLIADVKSRFAGVPYMSGQEYLNLGRTPHTNAFGRLKPRDVEVVEACIQSQSVDHLVQKMTTEMSDGERQLLAITRALIQESDYIFLDEPTAFLDYPNKVKCLARLKKIAAEQNKCIIFTSHDLELALQINPEVLCIPDNSVNLLSLGTNVFLETVIEHCFGEAKLT
jgi:iron complex transport system ATP-binding protein